MDSVKLIDKCLACGNDKLEEVFDLGETPLANAFKDSSDTVDEVFPLSINVCRNCNHIQLGSMVNPEILFSNYLYVSGTSKTQLDYFNWFSRMTIENYRDEPINVLDIGCNDGSLLDCYKELGLFTTGVDPAKNLCDVTSRNHVVHCGFFNDVKLGDKYDIITCLNAFAHNYDPLGFLYNVKELMHDDTLLYITTSQHNMMINCEYDTIYHEHLSFYCINSMNTLCKRAGLELVDVKFHEIHGTSAIYVISNGKKIKGSFNISNIINMDFYNNNIDSILENYKVKCSGNIQSIAETIRSYKRRNIPVIGYGAAAKGMTVLNVVGELIDFIIDDNPLKQGKFTAGSLSIPIYSSEIGFGLIENNNVLFVPLAWNFYNEIYEKIMEVRYMYADSFLKYYPKLKIDQPLQHYPV